MAENPKLAELVSIGYESTGLALFDLLQVAQAQTSFPIVIMGRVDGDSFVVEAVADLTRGGLRPGTTLELASRFEADVVALRSPVVVPDAAADEHFAERSRKSNMGSFLGVPIMFEDGSIFGTLAGYDPSARPIPKGDVQLFKTLARAASREIERTVGLESLALSGALPWKQLEGLATALAETWKEIDTDTRDLIRSSVEGLVHEFAGSFDEAATGQGDSEDDVRDEPAGENTWPADLDSVVARAPGLLPNLPGPRVRVEASSGVLVDLESRILERIVANLMLNAWKSAPPNTRMTISALRHGDWVEIAVADQSGLHADESRPRRLHPAGRGRIGLPIVKSLVEEAGGTVRQEATDDGRRYVARLPVLRGVNDPEPVAQVMPFRPKE